MQSYEHLNSAPAFPVVAMKTQPDPQSDLCRFQPKLAPVAPNPLDCMATEMPELADERP